MAQELKVYNVVATADVNPEVVDSLGCTEWAAYDADEVDAVLAENYAKYCENIAKQKYKRCLANAEACMHKRWRTDEGFDYARSHRHMNKWLALAEEFKEAK